MNVYHVKDEAGKVSIAHVEAETAEEAVASVKSELPDEHKELELEAKVIGSLPVKSKTTEPDYVAPEAEETKP